MSGTMRGVLFYKQGLNCLSLQIFRTLCKINIINAFKQNKKYSSKRKQMYRENAYSRRVCEQFSGHVLTLLIFVVTQHGFRSFQNKYICIHSKLTVFLILKGSKYQSNSFCYHLLPTYKHVFIPTKKTFLFQS